MSGACDATTACSTRATCTTRSTAVRESNATTIGRTDSMATPTPTRLDAPPTHRSREERCPDRLDFLNGADTIRDAFADFYRATILAGETDPEKVHDLRADLDAAQVHFPEQLDDLVQRCLGGADRDQLDSRFPPSARRSTCTNCAQVDFKGKAKAFVQTYGFLVVHPALHQRRLGEALGLSELPDLEAAGARGGGPVQGHP